MIIYCDMKVVEQEFAKFIGNSESNIKEYIDNAYIENLEVYLDNIEANLKGALDQTYRYTKALIGEECFNQIAYLYVRENIATSGNLDDYGQFFSQLVGRKLSDQLPYIEDIVKLEWLLQLAINEEDNDINNSDLLSHDELEKIQFRLHPAIYYFRSQYPIYDIWQLLIGEFVKEINYKAKGQNICILKRGCEPLVTNISNQEYDFIENINNKRNLLEILNIIGEQKLFEEIMAKFINDIIPVF